MIQHDTMRDMSVPLQEEDVTAVCRHMDAWCVRRNLNPLPLRKTDAIEAGSKLLERRVPARLYVMDKHYGRRMLDAWWNEEGRSLLWDTEQNVPRPEGAFLLMRTVIYSQLDLALWALDQGWSPHTSDAHAGGLTPLHRCVKAIGTELPNERVYLQLFKRLLTPLTVNYQTTDTNNTALALLVEKGHRWEKDDDGVVQMFEALLNAGADVSLPDRAGWTPLHKCVGRVALHMPAREALLKRLLRAGANPFAQMKGHLKENHAYSPPFTPLSLLETPWYQREVTEARTFTRLLQNAMRQVEAHALTTTLDTLGRAPASPPGRPRL